MMVGTVVSQEKCPVPPRHGDIGLTSCVAKPFGER